MDKAELVHVSKVFAVAAIRTARIVALVAFTLACFYLFAAGLSDLFGDGTTRHLAQAPHDLAKAVMFVVNDEHARTIAFAVLPLAFAGNVWRLTVGPDALR